MADKSPKTKEKKKKSTKSKGRRRQNSDTNLSTKGGKKVLNKKKHKDKHYKGTRKGT